MILKPEGLDSVNLLDPNGATDIKKIGFVNEINELKNVDGTSKSPQEFEIVYYKNGDMTSDANKLTTVVTINTPEDLKNLETLEKSRAIWTNEDGTVATPLNLGEAVFKPTTGALGGIMSIYKDTDDYIGQLNSLAKAVAYSVNAIHMEGYGAVPTDSIPFFVGSDNPLDYENIDASNIKINDSILKDPMKIQTGESKTSGSTDGKRALAIAGLRDLGMNIQDINNSTTYTDFKTTVAATQFDFTKTIPGRITSASGMKIEAFFKNSINKLGVQSQEAQRIVKNQETLLQGLVARRTSISGVSMDEEMVNLVQFQHAYQANAKMISTVDELLDVVINGLKR